MRKNGWNEKKAFRLRAISLAGFCVALSLVLMPPEGKTVATGSLASTAVHTGQAVLPPKLIPLGKTTGIKLFSRGTMVVGFSPLEEVGCCPAKEGGLKEGDVLLSLNGEEITGNEGLTALLSDLKTDQAVFRVLREEEEQTVTVQAFYDKTLDCRRIGAWVRDSVAGIGTITFVDPESGAYGALGHGVCDTDTGKLIRYGGGSVMPSTVESVEKSRPGVPGQLCGSFDLTKDQGSLLENGEAGIFGILSDETLYSDTEAMEVAPREAIHTGKALIRSNVSGKEVRDYEVEILRVYHENGEIGRDLMLQVTDPALLEQTGGIVQGCSGSPILQDGKLVGAVTHVLVNDPTRGYGIAIETMLERAEQALPEAA